MKLKTGDKVKILQGKDRGKTGKVLQVFIEKEKASVEGVNLMIKHLRPRRQGEKGQRVEFPAPLQISNLLLVCPKCKKASRIGFKLQKLKTVGDTTQLKKAKKVRVCKKCKAIID